MHNLPYELPEHGKIFYLLSDSEVNSFNYYKQHGSDHGLDVSLKMAVTEFGRVLTVQVKKITTIVKKVVSSATKKPESTNQSTRNRNETKKRNQSLLSEIELARKQGVPEPFIESYITNKKANESVKGPVCFGMYRKKSHKVIQSNLQEPQRSLKKPLTLIERIILLFKWLI